MWYTETWSTDLMGIWGLKLTPISEILLFSFKIRRTVKSGCGAWKSYVRFKAQPTDFSLSPKALHIHHPLSNSKNRYPSSNWFLESIEERFPFVSLIALLPNLNWGKKNWSETTNGRCSTLLLLEKPAFRLLVPASDSRSRTPGPGLRLLSFSTSFSAQEQK